MRMTLGLIAILTCLTVAALPAPAQQTTKEQDIRTLIEVTRMDRLVVQMIDLSMPQARQIILALRPDISKANLDLLLGEMADMFRQSAPQFIDAMIPVYAKRFTQDEIRDIVAFYETPTGKKMVAEQPALIAESTQMGQRLGSAIG